MIFDIGWEVTIPAIGLKPKGQGQNLARKRGTLAAFQPEELRKRTLRPQCVRNLAYLASSENDQSSSKSRICEMRYVANPRGVSSFRVFARRLVVPQMEHVNVRHATFSFLRLDAADLMRLRRGREDGL